VGNSPINCTHQEERGGRLVAFARRPPLANYKKKKKKKGKTKEDDGKSISANDNGAREPQWKKKGGTPSTILFDGLERG